MKIVPIRYCTDVAATVRFYRALGLDLGSQSRPGSWVELPATSGMLAIHQADHTNAASCELAFEADEPLEGIAARLRSADFEPEPIMDEGHGWSLRVRDPEGVWVQINLLDRGLYT